MPVRDTGRIWFFLLKLRCLVCIGNWWRHTETEVEIIVDPLFVHFNLACLIFGGINEPARRIGQLADS